MPRFFTYEEITEREPTPPEDLKWLAGQVAQLPAFIQGMAVVCGSVAWGSHSWRSDIDVAYFSTKAFPEITQSVEEVISRYQERTGDRFFRPKVQITTLGAETTSLVQRNVGSSYFRSVETVEQTNKELVVSTAIRFADHIESLAALKGAPWREFYLKYLAKLSREQSVRRNDLESYVAGVTRVWDEQPFHRLNSGPEGQLTETQLELLAHAENYPIHLMRRFLGFFNQYPKPDRASDVREAFLSISEPWANEIASCLEPFLKLESRYAEILAACGRPEGKLTAGEYYDQLRSMAGELPFSHLEEVIWNYLGKRKVRVEKTLDDKELRVNPWWKLWGG